MFTIYAISTQFITQEAFYGSITDTVTDLGEESIHLCPRPIELCRYGAMQSAPLGNKTIWFHIVLLYRLLL